MRSTNAIIVGVVLVAFSFLSLLIPAGMWVLFLSMFIISLSEIFAMPFMATVTVKRASSDRKGSYMGVNSLSFSAAFVFSPLIGTFVAEHFGFSALWISTTLLAIATALGFRWIFRKF
jgi:MFS family permease